MSSVFNFIGGTKAADFILANNPVDYIGGPIGSGKTKAMCLRVGRHAQEQRPSPKDGVRYTRFAMVRNTMPDLKRSTIRTWLETYPEDTYGRFTYGATMGHKLRYPFKDGPVHCEVDFISLDKTDDVKKLRSTEYTGVCFNELPFIEKELFDEADSRLRYPPQEHGGPTWRGVLGDGNAPDEDHWLATMAYGLDPPVGLAEADRALYEWPDSWGLYMQPAALIEEFDARGQITGYHINPEAENLKNLPADYYDRQLRGKTKAWIDSRLMNRVALVVEGQPVWPMFRREFHVSREALRPFPHYDVQVGLDFGRVHPAAVFAQEVGGRVYVQYEMLGFNEGPSVFAPKVQKFLTQHYPGQKVRFVGDPKGRDKHDEQSAYEIWAAHGMPVIPAPVKMNDIDQRVEAVAFALNDNPAGVNRVVISPVCRTLVVGMSGRYHLEREEKGALTPSKDKYSNLCFAAGTKVSRRRYSHGSLVSNIESLLVGDQVSTPFGPKRIIATGHRESDTVELLLSNGVKIRCTPDHPFWTDRGWVEAQHLGSERLIMEGETGCLLPSNSGHASEISPTSSEASDSTRARTDIFTAKILAASSSIEKFGRQTMEKSRTAMTSIMPTMTNQTTIQAILNACRSRITAGATCGAPSASPSLPSRSRSRSNERPKSAGQTRNGPEKSHLSPALPPSKQSLMSPYRHSSAPTADGTTKSSPLLASAASALCRVRGWLARHLGSTTKTASAPSAESPFARTDTLGRIAVRVVARGSSRRESVYNITVEDVHCYYAEGALVSNCDALQYLVLGLGDGRRMIGLSPIGLVMPAKIGRMRRTMRRIAG